MSEIHNPHPCARETYIIANWAELPFLYGPASNSSTLSCFFGVYKDCVLIAATTPCAPVALYMATTT